MTPQGGPERLRKLGIAAVFVALVAVAVVPGGMSFSGGIMTGDAGFDPEHGGCTSCHGGGAFATTGAGITVSFADADGNDVTALYEHGATYTVTIELDEQTGVGAANRAGFNLWADAGTFAEGQNTRVHADGSEATHTSAAAASWTVLWTAPDEGAVTFRLYVNDVDGSGAPDAGDQVYLRIFSLTDDTASMPGAVEEHEPHVGVELPQYWLGLIALASMAVVIIFGYVYLKYASPHNTGEKDR